MLSVKFLFFNICIILLLLETKNDKGPLVNVPLFRFPCTKIRLVTDKFKKATTRVLCIEEN